MGIHVSIVTQASNRAIISSDEKWSSIECVANVEIEKGLAVGKVRSEREWMGKVRIREWSQEDSRGVSRVYVQQYYHRCYRHCQHHCCYAL